MEEQKKSPEPRLGLGVDGMAGKLRIDGYWGHYDKTPLDNIPDGIIFRQYLFKAGKTRVVLGLAISEKDIKIDITQNNPWGLSSIMHPCPIRYAYDREAERNGVGS